MFFLKRKKIQQDCVKFAQDISSLQEWLYYFYQYNEQLLNFVKNQDSLLVQQKNDISELKYIVQNIPKTKEEFRKLVDSYFSFESIMDRLRRIEQRVEYFEQIKTAQIPKVSNSVSNIREKVLKKIAKNSKDYIKNLVLNLVIKYNKISALQLREIIVEEQGLCSKSSFYRILEELEREDSLNIISKGKIKVYLAVSSQMSEL